MTVSRRRFIKAGLAVGAVGVGTALAPDLVNAVGHVARPSRPLDLTVGTVIGVFSAGSGDKQVGIRNLAGVAPGGPQALAIRGDGTIAVLDTLNRRISIVDGSQIRSTIPLPTSIFPVDIREVGSNLYVLDQAGGQLLRIGGTAVSSLPLPSDRRSSVSRLAVGTARGAIGVVEEDTHTFDYTFDRNAQQPRAQRGFGDGQGGRVIVKYPRNMPRGRRSATIVTRLSQFEVQTTHALGSLVVLGFDAAGFMYLEVVELIESDGGLDVDITIRRYHIDGTFDGAARVPVRGRSSQPTTAVAVSPTGDAYAIVPDGTRTVLLRLVWSRTLGALKPLTSFLPVMHGFVNAAAIVPNTRSQAINKAQTFLSWSWTLTAEMRARSCFHTNSGTSSTLPSYLTAPGNYINIPYCWGAFDEPAAYVLRINSPYNMAPGDTHGIDGVPWRGCTAGADCSGFIQQCWGIGPPKQGTESLLNWVTNSPGQSQAEGGTLFTGRHVAVAERPRADAFELSR